ncbi:hypothetical protein BOTBODRAFT_188176 [Botryobasidium botryosum FD-172 SS1]|uniref:Extracellular membrane protein CFEM domain-containing protein n=1 Tax=Botryobasidium botryosum (strain FD-172 SS1) TaxID=930990 RepID=A0A067MQ32_BOTB1|nr:hypothetical protein BOTBODRAFT_188176 [Botryobasidium botryosum FD-172 SS1]
MVAFFLFSVSISFALAGLVSSLSLPNRRQADPATAPACFFQCNINVVRCSPDEQNCPCFTTISACLNQQCQLGDISSASSFAFSFCGAPTTLGFPPAPAAPQVSATFVNPIKSVPTATSSKPLVAASTSTTASASIQPTSTNSPSLTTPSAAPSSTLAAADGGIQSSQSTGMPFVGGIIAGVIVLIFAAFLVLFPRHCGRRRSAQENTGAYPKSDPPPTYNTLPTARPAVTAAQRDDLGRRGITIPAFFKPKFRRVLLAKPKKARTRSPSTDLLAEIVIAELPYAEHGNRADTDDEEIENGYKDIWISEPLKDITPYMLETKPLPRPPPKTFMQHLRKTSSQSTMSIFERGGGDGGVESDDIRVGPDSVISAPIPVRPSAVRANSSGISENPRTVAGEQQLRIQTALTPPPVYRVFASPMVPSPLSRSVIR